MKKNATITILSAASVIICLSLFITQRQETDPFQTCINKLTKRESPQDIRDAETGIVNMGQAIVPRLLSELDNLKSTLTRDEIYSMSSGKSIQHDARLTLARGNIYSLISILDVNTYSRIVTDSCRSNNPEIFLILSGADCQNILALPKEQLSIFTNTLSKTLTSVETDAGNKAIIETFFTRLAFQKHLTDSYQMSLRTIGNQLQDKTNE
jgi:hypothetical protein